MMDNIVELDFRRAKNPKFEQFCKWIDLGMVMVTIDATVQGVEVPSEFAQDEDLRLNFSHRFGLKDFVYDEKQISATLMFPKGYFYCVIPWEAVYGLQSQVTQEGIVWPDHAPNESPQKSHLRLVKTEE